MMRNRTNVISRRRRSNFEMLCMLLLAVPALSRAGTAHAQDPAPTPTGLWAAQTAATQITVRWDTVPDATEYRLYQRVSETEIKRIATPARTRNFWVIPLTSTSAGKTLQYQLSAIHPKLGESAIVPFNAVTLVTATPSTPAAPGGVSAALTDSDEVTLRWDAVPGATAYAIGRSVTPYGFMPLCTLCPTSTTYVDRAVTPRQGHTYTVEAIMPGGRSRRATSNMVPVPAPGPAGVGSLVGGVVNIISGLLGGTGSTLGIPRPPITASASAKGGDGVQLSWQALPSDSPSAFVVERAINLGEFKPLATIPGDQREYTDRGLPQVYENGRMRVTYEIRTRNRIGTSLLGMRPYVVIENAGAPSTAAFCAVDYRRADNMWAERGKATPIPGLETLRLDVGESQRFGTNWSNEKQRNDGKIYYGAHLRQLLNTGPREVHVFVRSLDPAVAIYAVEAQRARNIVDMTRQAIRNTLALTATRRHGLFAALIKVRPGEVIGVRADLLEVVCPKI